MAMVSGYPAYAGIDLLNRAHWSEKQRLPRIRGDRPIAFEIKGREDVATPHTRGSTIKGKTVFIEAHGYPAYAGIDQSPHRADPPCTRLPRIRGDRPVPSRELLTLIPATPHTRGSTLIPSKGTYYIGGYPAYAGIDLGRLT